MSLVDDQYKLYSADRGKTFELYDLIADPGEKKDLAGEKPELVASMAHTLKMWRASCQASNAGEDYR